MCADRGSKIEPFSSGCYLWSQPLSWDVGFGGVEYAEAGQSRTPRMSIAEMMLWRGPLLVVLLV